MGALRLPFPCPAPGAEVDWSGFHAPWIAPMVECRQEPEWHGEGDVWTHTRRVCDELVRLQEWRVLPEDARQVLFAAAAGFRVECNQFEP